MILLLFQATTCDALFAIKWPAANQQPTASSTLMGWRTVLANSVSAYGKPPGTGAGVLKRLVVGNAQNAAAQPSIRYCHSMVSLPDGSFVVSHGYFYDSTAKGGGAPAWLSDTWRYAPAGTTAASRQGGEGWARLHIGDTEDNLERNLPVGRYGHVAAVADNGATMLLHGGTDGGHRLRSAGINGFQPGYELDDLWTFDLVNRVWRAVPRGGDAWPTKRYLHTLVRASDDAFWMYGGLDVASDDALWRLVRDVEANGGWRWERASAAAVSDSGGPGQRYGHAAVSDGRGGMMLFGGRTGGVSMGSTVTNDLWHLDATKMQWHLLGPPPTGTGGGAIWPGKRIYAAASALVMPRVGGGDDGGGDDVALLVHGGSSEIPRVRCQNETWLWHPHGGSRAGRWMRLPSSPLPTYHHTIVTAWVSPGRTKARPGDDDVAPGGGIAAAFTFGGHACVGHVEQHGYYYYNSVERLDIGPLHNDAHVKEHDDAGL